MNNCQKINPSKHRGVVTVEFTMVAVLLFFAIFAIIGIARVVYIYNAAVNATRMGARLAVVCAPSAESNIKAKMIAKVPQLAATGINSKAEIKFTYNTDADCIGVTCNVTSVTVALSTEPETAFKVEIATPAGFPLGSITLPGFSTTLTRESMNSANNSVCS